jgi:hypothetical protein
MDSMGYSDIPMNKATSAAPAKKLRMHQYRTSPG